MTAEQQLPAPAQAAPFPSTDVFGDPWAFEHAQRVAKVLASSALVPKHFQNNISDCLIVLQIARRLGEEPLTVAQNLYIVNGRPGWSAAYMIARANRAGVFSGHITWDVTGKGDDLSVTAMATLARTGEPIEATCDMQMAKAEGWTKNPKYGSMPSHMLKWRSASMLVKLFCPEVMLGIPMVEEDADSPPPIRDVTPATPPRSTQDRIKDFARHEPAARSPQADADGGADVAQQPGVPDPLQVAHDRGRAARAGGHKRAALPGEYRSDERAEEAAAWQAGFDGQQLPLPEA